MFENFVFPDGTAPQWNSVNWLQKTFMKWFNNERLKKILTFPVETVNLLNDGKNFVDNEWADFTAEMWSEGHSFFVYTSDSVDSLASCCFDGSQMTLTKSSNGINYMSFKDIYEANTKDYKRNFTIFHNGNWVQGKVIKAPKRPLYKITTANNKEIIVTDNHISPTQNGDKLTIDLTTNDYLMFSTKTLNSPKEVDMHLTYNQGFLIGMYLGDGSMCDEDKDYTTTTMLSLNESKYNKSIDILEKAMQDLNVNTDVKLGKPYNHVYPVSIRNADVASFIRQYVSCKFCFEKRFNLNCV